MLKDILKESWTFQEMRDELRNECLLEGGLIQIRQDVVDIVQDRFPELEQLAKDVVSHITDLTQLRHLLLKLSSSAHSAEQARQILLAFKR